MPNDASDANEKSRFKKWDFIIGIMMVSYGAFKIILLFYDNQQTFDWYTHGFAITYFIFGSFLIYRYFFLRQK